MARYESEFTVCDENSKIETHPIRGSILLDGDLNFVYAENGEVMLEPYWTLIRKGSSNREDSGIRGKGVPSTDEIDKLLGGSN